MYYSSPDSSVHEILQARVLSFHFPTPGALPDPGIESSSLLSLALADGFFTTAPPWEPTSLYCNSNHFLIPEPISLSGGHLNSTKLRNFPPIFLLKCFKRMKTWSYLCLEKIKKKINFKKKTFWWCQVLVRIWNNCSAPTLLGRCMELGIITLRKRLPAFMLNIPTLYNKCMDTNGEAGWDELGEWDCHIYTAIIKQITNENLLCSTGNSIHCPVET